MSMFQLLDTPIDNQLTLDFSEREPSSFERFEAKKHREEIDRQFRVLVFNCPWKVWKFWKQRRQLFAEIDQKLFEGFYLQP